MGFASAALAAIGSKALDIGGTAANAAMSYEANRRLQQKAFDWEEKKLKNATQWHMQDLKAAGINPILAAQTGLATGSVSGSVGIPSSGTTDFSNYSKAITAKKAQKAQEKLQNAEVNKAQAEQRAAEATAKRLEAENATNAPRYKAEKEFFDSKVGNILHKIGLGAKELSPAVSAIGGGIIGGGIMRGLKNATTARKAATSVIIRDNNGRAYIPGDKIHEATKEDWAKLAAEHLSPRERGYMRYPNIK